ncbi:MAG: 16S rRNA (cytidine(1402)-2'-O)-methyltransferase [Actinomycetota bacterium]|jgi:16S rRNA (cytidine1402-2'-O)-methyltransferase
MTGELLIVATPIGNLGDASRRMLEVLESADVVYCEDTRHSRTLFSANAISPRGRLEALHEHNEASLCEQIIQRVAEGQRVAIITDAGTPGVSDPGARVIAAVATAGLRVSPIPGPSAVIAALSVSGLPMDRFCMEGFAPRKAGERQLLWDRLEHVDCTTVLFESPNRVADCLSSMVPSLGDRAAVVARELTKLHEEVVRGTVRELASLFAAREVRGEIVIVVAGAAPLLDADDATLEKALAHELAAGASTKNAARDVASLYGVSTRRVYELALLLRSEASS